MADIASLDISVTAAGVKQAAADLRSLGRAAADSDSAIQSITGTLSWLKGQNMQAFAANLQQATQALLGSKDAFKEFSTSAGNLSKSSTSMSAIATATEKLVTNESGLSGIATSMERIKTSLVEMQGAAGVISKLSNVGGASSVTINSGASASNYSSTTSAVNGLTQAQNRALANLEREAYLVNHSKAEWLEYKAAQLGVSQQASQYVNTLKSVTTQTNDFGMSQKGLNAAMRNVPAQFTDIVVSLQGGQAPMTVLLQQGGQLKDMFGGVGNAAKALAEYIAKLVTPLTVVGAAIAGVGYMWYKGSQEAEVFNKALNKTGGYLGITSDQFTAMSKAIGNSTSQGAEALTALASSGKFTGDNIQQLAQTTLNWSKVSGESISKVVSHFEEIQESPAKAIVKLNEQYHFLTASTYSHIVALEAQGNKMEAARVAQEAFASAATSSHKKMLEDMGLLQLAWRNLTGWIATAKDAMMDLGRNSTQQENLKKVNDELIKQINWYDKLKAGNAGQRAMAEDVLKEINALRQKREVMMGNISSSGKEAQLKAQQAKQEQDLIEKLEKYNQLAGGTLTKEQAVSKAKQETNDLVSRGLMSQEAAEKAVLAVSKQYDKFKDTAAETEQKRVEDKLKALDSEKAGLAETLKIQQDKLAVLYGQQTAGEGSNQYTKKAAELEEKIKNEKNTSLRASMEEELRQLNIAASYQNQIDKKTESNALDEKMKKQAESLEKAIGSEYDKLSAQHTLKLQEIDSNTYLSAQQKKKLTDLENQTFELEKQKKLATSPVEKLTAEYNINMASVDKEFDPVKQHEENEKKKTDLTKTYSKQRADLVTSEARKESSAFNIAATAAESMGSTAASGLTSMLVSGKSAREVMNSLGETLLSSVLSSLIQIGVKESLNFAASMFFAKTLTAAELAKTTTVVTGSALETGAVASAQAAKSSAIITANTAALPSAVSLAAAESVITVGQAAAIGIGALVAGWALSKTLHDNGGNISAGEVGIVGEYGPELVTGPAHVTSRQDTAKALGNGTSNVTVVNQTSAKANASVTKDSNGDLLVTLTEALPDLIASQAGNPHSKMNKALGSVYAMRRN